MQIKVNALLIQKVCYNYNMELIRRLGTRVNKNGYITSYAEFYCCFCKQIVERPLSYKDCKSCGCEKGKLISESNKKREYSEETKQKISKSNKGKSKNKGRILTNEWRQKISESKKGQKPWNKGRRNVYSEDTIQKMSNSHKGKKLEKDHKQKISEKTKGINNPFYGKKHTEETIQKLKSFVGELSSNWQNGKSFEEYGIEFTKDLKNSILKRDNYTCQNPDCNCKSGRLDVHHIDYNKKNNNPNNLIILCVNCHSKTNGKNKRVYFTTFYQQIMIIKLC